MTNTNLGNRTQTTLPTERGCQTGTAAFQSNAPLFKPEFVAALSGIYNYSEQGGSVPVNNDD